MLALLVEYQERELAYRKLMAQSLMDQVNSRNMRTVTAISTNPA